jgi:hypothetical protein
MEGKVTEMDEQVKAAPDTKVFQDELETPIPMDDAHTSQIEHQWKLYTARFEYAWRYFDFHATQRTTMFNFFVVFSGFLITACVALFQKGDDGLLVIASVFGTATTGFFVCLERRNEELVHIAEEVLRALEQDVLFKNLRRTIQWPKQRKWWGEMVQRPTEVPLGIFVRQDYDEVQKHKSVYEHGNWLPMVQYAIGLVYLLFILFAILGPYVPRSTRAFWQFVSTLCHP